MGWVVAEGYGDLADVDLDTLSDVTNNGASAAPINFAHESFPVLLVDSILLFWPTQTQY